MTKVKVIHKACGGQVGWFLGCTDDYVASHKTFQRLDGTHPVMCEEVAEKCDRCGATIREFWHLERVWPEDLDSIDKL